MGNIPNTTTNGLVLTSVGNGSNDSQWAINSSAGSVTLAGDVTGASGSNTVAKINGTALGTLTGATNGYVLTWNSSSSTWVAAAGGNTLGGYAVNVSALNPTTDTGAMLTFNYNSFTGLSQWVETYVPTGTGSMFFWNGTNWESTSTTGIATGNVLIWNNSTSKWAPGNITLAGDVTGSTGANTVIKLQNYPVNVTGLTGSGSIMFYSTTGSQFNFSGGASATGSIMYWNGSSYVPTTPSGTGVLQWNSGSSTYSYVAVGGSTPNNDAWSANPQITAQAIPYNGTSPYVQAVNSVAFNNGSYLFSKFLVTWSAAQSNAASGTSNLTVNIVETGGILVGLYTVGQVLTTTRNTFSGSFVYTQATPASSTMTLQFSWQSNITGQLNWSNLSVVGIY
jgi:hypothetical protein